jgi:arylsulfatase A-like enzyme
MQAPTDVMRRFNNIGDEHRQVFAAMLSAMDDGVGAILKGLRDAQLEEDTLVFFISDNGGPTAELTSSNLPLRGGKGQLWEGGIREPFLVQWKGKIPAGRVLRQPVISLDILPTAVAAAGGKPKAGVDGVDLMPLLSGSNTAAPHDLLFWRLTPSIAVRKGDWKLVRQGSPGVRNPDFELYNLEKDISEKENLAGQRPELVRELRADLERLNAEMMAPRW